ncbi:MAG: sugar phosphate nucleotidyltransferase [Brevinema sp.]
MNPINMKDIIGIVLAGGQGTRLDPLTRHRSKPAVPFGGKYRIIDFPITNCIHSGVGKIFVLTQYHSASLNQHITQTYKFDLFHDSFVDIIASEASKDLSSAGFSQGTADAVRKGMHHIKSVRNASHALILAGDQLYQMDFTKLRNIHNEFQADLTLGVVPIPRSEANAFGIVKVSSEYQVLDFWEKPGDTEIGDDWYIPKNLQQKFNLPDGYVFASMSMYLIGLELLDELLVSKTEMMDFGKEIIPYIIKNYGVRIAIHNSYWEDIGTLYNFHKANMDLTETHTRFNIYDADWYTLCRPSLSPPSVFEDCSISRSIVGDGGHIRRSTIIQSVIGQRMLINQDTHIEKTVIMGCDWVETDHEKEKNKQLNIPNMGIGKNCIIKNAIIDKNARIGNNVILVNEKGLDNHVDENYVIRDGIIVIPSKSTIPDNFKI